MGAIRRRAARHHPAQLPSAVCERIALPGRGGVHAVPRRATLVRPAVCLLPGFPRGQPSAHAGQPARPGGRSPPGSGGPHRCPVRPGGGGLREGGNRAAPNDRLAQLPARRPRPRRRGSDGRGGRLPLCRAPVAREGRGPSRRGMAPGCGGAGPSHRGRGTGGSRRAGGGGGRADRGARARLTKRGGRPDGPIDRVGLPERVVRGLPTRLRRGDGGGPAGPRLGTERGEPVGCHRWHRRPDLLGGRHRRRPRLRGRVVSRPPRSLPAGLRAHVARAEALYAELRRGSA